MSLIQEALRRKDEDEGGARITPPPRVIPPTNDVPPVLKIPEKRKEGGSKNWLVLILSLAVVLLLIFAALGLLLYSTGQMAKFAESGSPPSQPADPEFPLAVNETGAVPEKLVLVQEKSARPSVPAEVERARSSEAVPEPSTPPASTAPVAPVRRAATPRSATQAAVSSVESRRPPVITEIPRKSLEGVRTVPMASGVTTSIWPRLSLHGVMAQAGPNQGSAIINGTVVEVGERIDGARLMEVQRNGVLLEFKGNTQFVRVGQSTF